MKALLTKPAFWVVVIILIMGLKYAYTANRRKILIARIEERFGSMAGLNEKTVDQLEQILQS